jgi:hypothetical protein
VVALGPGADVKPPGNLLGIEALGKGLQHLQFAVGEPRDGLLSLILLFLASPAKRRSSTMFSRGNSVSPALRRRTASIISSMPADLWSTPAAP